MAIELEVVARNDFGRGASRRHRRNEQTPAIIIGQGKEAVTVLLDEKKLIAAALKAEFFEGLTLSLNGEKLLLNQLTFSVIQFLSVFYTWTSYAFNIIY